ncbi:CTD phosphatase Fcp1, variant 2 [Basidiobolus ranarum]
MTHDAFGLRVSTEEAERLEKETSDRLLRSRKLSLIVDLDQTIIHAAVDPTIEDWMNDENNINHAATNEIAKFVLPDSPTVYYIKLRPGLREFLKEITKIYELHIYTMGTRNYASAVANVIDPDKEFFKERILSRDESGSMTQKTIQRLFPCDTSMVVIIDDRGDVWQWSPNLIKVNPYDFFVGIGDINGSFLPKQETVPMKSNDKMTNPKLSMTKASQKAADKNEDDQVDETVLAQQEQEQNEIMESQKANKPLQQLQQQQQEQVEQKPILIDNDMELSMLLKVLQDIHSKFYQEYELVESQESGTNRRVLPDVKNIIPSMKNRVLKNTNIVFSSVIPLGYDPTKSDIWCLARSFGAQCSTNLNSQITHIVAGKPGTAKVNHARKMADVFVVRPEWLFDSISRWERQDERLYSIDDSPSAQSTLNSMAPQSDEEVFEFGGQVLANGANEEDEDDQLMIDDNEMNEHMMRMDWGDAAREVEEFLDDSDFNTATSEVDSEKDDDGDDGSAFRKRKSGEFLDPESVEFKGIEESERNGIKRMRALRAHASPLKNSVSFMEDDDFEIQSDTVEDQNASDGVARESEGDEADHTDGNEHELDDDDDDDDDFLDDFTREIEEELNKPGTPLPGTPSPST